MDGKAIIITGGILDDIHAKTTHGLVRGTDRYEIVGVIDANFAGRDSGEVIDQKPNGIPIFENIDEFFKRGITAEYCIIGVATKGGVIPDEMKVQLRDAIIGGLSIVNGLHEFLEDIPELKALAKEAGVELIDIRKPRPKSELKFWTGEIYKVKCPIVAVLGTDCAVGKRTTARMLLQDLIEKGINAEMIYTGQTGWLCGIAYGFIFDATYNDFIGGELEHAIVSCYQEKSPDIILLAGQSSLRNPSGPAGSEYLLSGNAKGVILVHPPSRTMFKGFEDVDAKMPDLANEIELIKYYGSKTLGIALNSEDLDPESADTAKSSIQKDLNLPVNIPLQEGVNELVDALTNYISNFNHEN